MGVTGYDRSFYRDVERIRKAQERLAAVETARYCREVEASTDASDATKALAAKLRAENDAAIGVKG